MTWEELFNQIPPERRKDEVHILDEDPAVLDWGNISLRRVGDINHDYKVDNGASTGHPALQSLVDDQYVLVFES